MQEPDCKHGVGEWLQRHWFLSGRPVLVRAARYHGHGLGKRCAHLGSSRWRMKLINSCKSLFLYGVVKLRDVSISNSDAVHTVTCKW